MNNIKSFNQFTGIELEQIVYDQELNEGSIMGKGIRGRLNKRASKKVREELAEEIEMSKTIMEDIKQGLEALSDNFDTIQKSLDASDENDKKKGEKQKLLEDITKILENSKKSTWDLNELIDEGEIDYTGFTANIGIASVAHFGILFSPVRAAFMIHKGYKYFFAIVKNTIRKALVMLQLNFDQFSNLIVTQSMKAAGVITATDTSNDIGEFYGNILAQLQANKSLNKTQYEKTKRLLDAAKQNFDQTVKADKLKNSAENLYNNLDPYNNTYTKSLEALKQYSADDVQKHLDAIKNSMTKLAGQEVDLQTYSELILAVAEEHAYEVSTSIYNKFAKMTEVFSLPNQQKLINLILAANKEQADAAKKARQEMKTEKLAAETNEKEAKCAELFKSVDGVELGEYDEESKKYDESSIKADNWTYEEFDKLDKDDQETLESWLDEHQEVLDKCDETLQVYVTTPPSKNMDTSYIDSIIDYIGPCLIPLDESYSILTFDEYILESEKKSSDDDDIDIDDILSEDEKKDLDEKIEEVEKNFTELLTSILGEDYKKPGFKMTDEQRAKLEYILSKCEDDDTKEEIKDKLTTFKKSISPSGEVRNFCIDLQNINNSQTSDLKELYKVEDIEDLDKNENKYVPVVALKAIGKKVLNDGTFVKNSKSIVKTINKCFDSKKVKVSFMTYILLANSIKGLKDERSYDYSRLNPEPDKEKSGK